VMAQVRYFFRMRLCSCAALFLAAMAHSVGAASIYKCLVDGKVIYSDRRCEVSAEEISAGAYAREKGHRTLHSRTIINQDQDGAVHIEREVILPDPDLRPGLRPGEKAMLRDVKRKEAIRSHRKYWNNVRDEYRNESYSERLRRRNERIGDKPLYRYHYRR